MQKKAGPMTTSKKEKHAKLNRHKAQANPRKSSKVTINNMIQQEASDIMKAEPLKDEPSDKMLKRGCSLNMEAGLDQPFDKINDILNNESTAELESSKAVRPITEE